MIKNNKKSARYLLPFVTLIAILMFSCQDQRILSPANEVNFSSQSRGIPNDQIQKKSWNADATQQLTSLARRGTQTKLIQANHGGHVGGGNTFHNRVDIPDNALDEDTYITVDVLCVENNQQCDAEVDFLPSMEFLTDVTVTLSWEYLELEEDEEFDAFYSQNNGETWFAVEEFEVDYEHETLSFDINHFTRFAWGKHVIDDEEN